MCSNVSLSIAKELREETSVIEKALKSLESIILELEKDNDSERVRNMLKKIDDVYESMIDLDRKADELIRENKLELTLSNTESRKSEYFKALKQKIWAVNHHNEPPPGYEDDIFGGYPEQLTEDDIMCPYTYVIMKEPVKSTLCGHSYSREGIENYFEYNKKKKLDFVECPVQGCAQRVRKIDLVPNVALENQVKIYLKLHPELLEEENEEILSD